MKIPKFTLKIMFFAYSQKTRELNYEFSPSCKIHCDNDDNNDERFKKDLWR